MVTNVSRNVSQEKADRIWAISSVEICTCFLHIIEDHIRQPVQQFSSHDQVPIRDDRTKQLQSICTSLFSIKDYD